LQLGRIVAMNLPTRLSGDLQHKMQGLNSSIFILHFMNDRLVGFPVGEVPGCEVIDGEVPHPTS
jgi:hypothetical protein